MIVYLEIMFDALVRIDAKTFDCAKGRPLQITEPPPTFFVQIYPKNSAEHLPYACIFNVAAETLRCDCTHAKICRVAAGAFLAVFYPCEIAIASHATPNVTLTQTASRLYSKNFSTNFNSFEFAQGNKTLTVFKNFSSLYNCGKVEKFDLSSPTPKLKETFCARKRETPASHSAASATATTSTHDPIFALFEAARAGFYSEAKKLLSPALTATMKDAHLASFFAPYSHIAKNIYTNTGYILYGETAAISPAFIKISLTPGNDIDNITEIS